MSIVPIIFLCSIGTAPTQVPYAECLEISDSSGIQRTGSGNLHQCGVSSADFTEAKGPDCESVTAQAGKRKPAGGGIGSNLPELRFLRFDLLAVVAMPGWEVSKPPYYRNSWRGWTDVEDPISDDRNRSGFRRGKDVNP
jgi:hypothetical protein